MTPPHTRLHDATRGEVLRASCEACGITPDLEIEDANALRIDPACFPLLDQLAPGVLGHAEKIDGALWIPVIVSPEPGRGRVSRYLDSLPRDRPVIVPCVISSRLAGMLARRGFVSILLSAPEEGYIATWSRDAEEECPPSENPSSCPTLPRSP